MPITVFNRSVNGYNRQQVDEYIADINRAFVRSRNDYEKKIEILEAEISKLKRELEGAQAEPAPAVSAPAVEKTDRDVTEKSRRYDEISQRIGEILISANEGASAIIRYADERVQSTLTDTTETLKAQFSAFIDCLTRLSDEAQSRLSAGGTDTKDGEDA